MGRRPAITGNFRILVIPENDVQPAVEFLSIPPVVKTSNYARVVAEAYVGRNNDVGVSAWAFTKTKRAAVVKQLRALADWVESNVPSTGVILGFEYW